jgi:hypothetical protein
MKIASAVMSALFLVAAALQYNDPDPLGWAAIYLAAAVASGLAAAGRLRWWTAAAVGLAALIWAATLAPRVIESGMLRDVARSMGPETGAEEARELIGLTLIVLWMAILWGRISHHHIRQR